MSTITINVDSRLRITPTNARPEVFFGDSCAWTLVLPTPHQDGDTYAIALDHDSIIWPLADALVDAGTDIATVSEDGKSVAFSFGLLSDRMRQWISGVERAMPMIVQAVRYRDDHAETILADVILARPVAIGGPIATGPQEDPDLDTLAITLTTDPETGAQTLTLAQYGGETVVHLPPSDVQGTDVQLNGVSITVDGVANIVTGQANGIAPLDASTLVPVANLPKAEPREYGIVRPYSAYGTTVTANYLAISRASETYIDAKTETYRPIVPLFLDYAVRSVLPNVTAIPAETTTYSLLDASATTNSHSWNYTHAPTSAPTYTLPAVSSTTVLHESILEVTFSSVQTYAFQDAAGNVITPLSTPDIQAGSVIVFLCRYSAAIGNWYIVPIPVGGVPAQA